MKFYRKDLMLAAGCALVGAGIAAYMHPVIGASAAAGIFFIIKIFLVKSSSALLKAASGGICIHCGQKADECPCEN